MNKLQVLGIPFMCVRTLVGVNLRLRKTCDLEVSKMHTCKKQRDVEYLNHVKHNMQTYILVRLSLTKLILLPRS